MTFLEAEERFQRLEEARRAGKLAYPQYVEAVHALRVVDDAGLVWMIQEQTGQWFVFTGGAWVASRPPVSAPPAPPPPPPAPEPEPAAIVEPEPLAAVEEPEPEPEPIAADVEELEPLAAAPEPEPEPEPIAAAPEPEPEPEPAVVAADELVPPEPLKKPAPMPGKGAGALPAHLRPSGVVLPPHLRASGASPRPAPAPVAAAAPRLVDTKPAPAVKTAAAAKAGGKPKTGHYFLWFLVIWAVIAAVVYLIWGREQPGILGGVALAAGGSLIWMLVTLNRAWSGAIDSIKVERVFTADDDGGEWEDITYAYVRQPNGKLRKERWIKGWEVGDFLEKRRGETIIRCTSAKK